MALAARNRIRATRFTQADIKRAVRGAQKAKLSVAGVRIDPDGAITIIHGEPQAVAPSATLNEWDE